VTYLLLRFENYVFKFSNNMSSYVTVLEKTTTKHENVV